MHKMMLALVMRLFSRYLMNRHDSAIQEPVNSGSESTGVKNVLALCAFCVWYGHQSS
jgi:hypothetical protein